MPDTPPPPLDVAAEAEACLRRSPFLALHDVACSFADGVLTLQGCLPSQHLKQQAQAAVMGVAGVTEIRNLIGVVTLEQRRNCSGLACPRLKLPEQDGHRLS